VTSIATQGQTVKTHDSPYYTDTYGYTISYGRFVLHPGDVILFYGGLVTDRVSIPGIGDIGFPFVYGHAAIYLGRGNLSYIPSEPYKVVHLNEGPELASQREFLDFQRTLDQPLGRIVNEEEFLRHNKAYGHPAFDVIRVDPRLFIFSEESSDKTFDLDGTLSLALLHRALPEATKQYGAVGWSGKLSFEDCSQAVAHVLEPVVRPFIPGITPDALANSHIFHKIPGLEGKTIDIDFAISEMEARKTRDAQALAEAVAKQDASRAREQAEHDAWWARSEADSQWNQLEFWTLCTCNYLTESPPSTDTSREYDKAWEKSHALDRREMLNRFAVLPADELRTRMKTDHKELSKCQRQILDLILSAPAPLDEKWLLDRVEYEQAGGKTGEAVRRFVNHVEQAIRSGAAVLAAPVEWIVQPGQASGDAAPPQSGTNNVTTRSGNGSQSTRPAQSGTINTAPRSGNFNGHLGPAWNQLRGVAASPRRFDTH
jgi:hypothetical protein